MSYGRRLAAILPCLFFILLTVNCGGGGGGSSSSDDSGGGSTDVTGLEIASQMSLVADDSSSSSSLSRLLRNAVGDPSAPTSGAYVDDVAEVYTYDPAFGDGIEFVGMLLCFFSQTHHEEFVNQGAFTVIIDEALCEGRQNKGGSANDQSGQSDTSFVAWAIEATRVDSNSPEFVNVWVPGDEDEGEILGELVIEEAQSDTAPLGIWIANFMSSGGDMSGTVAVGRDAQGDTTVKMAMTEFGSTHTVDAVVAQGGSGYGHIEGSGMSEDGGASGFGGSSSADIAYNTERYLSRFNGSDLVCRSRNPDDMMAIPYAYNVYDATGALKELNTGFPIQFGEYYGWMGYWGLWLPEEAGAANGDTVMRIDGEEGIAHTILETAGRLTKRVREAFLLEDLVGQTFFSWDNETSETIIVRIDSTQGEEMNLVKIGTEFCDDNGCSRTFLDEPLLLDPGSFGWLSLWKENTSSTIVADEFGKFYRDTEFPIFHEETVFPDDPLLASGLNLACYGDYCPKKMSFEDFVNGDVMYPFDWSQENPEPFLYTIGSDYVLRDAAGDPIEIAVADESVLSSLDPSSPFYWGVHSNAMIDVSLLSFLENFWNVWDEPVTYTYSTGPHRWNHVETVRDPSGVIPSFDSPLSFQYNDLVYGLHELQYGGKGQLWGMPWNEVDIGGGFTRWIPEFTIPEGTLLMSGDDHYYVRQMIVENVMLALDSSECTALTIDDTLGDPGLTFEEPSGGDNPCAAGSSCPTAEELAAASSS